MQILERQFRARGDVKQFKPLLNSIQKSLRKRFTKARKCGDEWIVCLEAGSQRFHIFDPCNKQDAEWFRDMLAIALAAIVEASKTKL